jgi:hypothetical protein
MGNTCCISQLALDPPGGLADKSDLRLANCSTLNVLPPSAQGIQRYHYAQDLDAPDFVATDSSGIFAMQSQTKSVGVSIVNPLADKRWDALVARHRKASAFHQRSWLEALSRTYGYEPVVFTTSSANAELENGLVFCRIKSWLTGNRLVSLPFSDHCEPLCDSAEEMNAVIRGSQGAFDFKHGEYLEVRPTSEDFGRAGAGMGFQPAAKYFLHLIDLRPKVDDLFRSFDKDSVQRRITRAEKAGLIERCGSSEELLRHFYGLFVLTRNRHHLPPPPYSWFQNLLQCQGTALEIRVAYLDEIPIAAILTLGFRKTRYFKYGCSDARFNKFAATPWLLWRAIVAAKSNGALEFDLGRTQVENAGLLAFKSHWVPRHQQLTYWKFPGTTSRRNMADSRMQKMATRVFSYMPQRLLVATGKLVYRHIG